MLRLQNIVLLFCFFFTTVFASAIVTRDITTLVDSLNAEGSAMETLTTQTSAFTSADCSVLGGLLTQTVLLENKIQQAGTDIAASPGSLTALECDQIKTAISNLLPAHSLGLYLTSAKKPDFIACGLPMAGIKDGMTNMRAKTATIFTNLIPKVSGACALSIRYSRNALLGYWDLAITGYQW
ncbi:hypothetical protein B9Z19DRAFT_1122963 [Tuber borchii]|uniref:Hydrophobic surface binding protein A-domain-containing protein n=1 Tax=Tuber borchii TaxID=42251 RepID=A0A2T6ZZ97_TUBBO|nr:hypothetical protein B9Z19DRAFT_1122963 [Tuber borchii]